MVTEATHAPFMNFCMPHFLTSFWPKKQLTSRLASLSPSRQAIDNLHERDILFIGGWWLLLLGFFQYHFDGFFFFPKILSQLFDHCSSVTVFFLGLSPFPFWLIQVSCSSSF
jgi:hypothetical protein